MDPKKRSIGNAVQVFFKDGTSTENVEVKFPIGHRRRRSEGIPLLEEKFERNIKTRLPDKQTDAILQLFSDSSKLDNTKLSEFVDLWETSE